MLLDQIAASLPTENVLEHTYRRRRELQAVQKHHRKQVILKDALSFKSKYCGKHAPLPDAPPKPEKASIDKATVYLIRRQGRRDVFLDPNGNEWIPLQTQGSIHRIKMEVCRKYGIEMCDLDASRRNVNSVQARFEYFWRARRETKWSFPDIGRFCGGKDHSTVIHGIKRYKHFQQLLKEHGPKTIVIRNRPYDLSKVIPAGDE